MSIFAKNNPARDFSLAIVSLPLLSSVTNTTKLQTKPRLLQRKRNAMPTKRKRAQESTLLSNSPAAAHRCSSRTAPTTPTAKRLRSSASSYNLRARTTCPPQRPQSHSTAIAAAPAALTEENLRALNGDIMPPQAPSTPSRKSVSDVTRTSEREAIDIRNALLARSVHIPGYAPDTELPASLQELVDRVKTERPGPTTPASKNLARLHNNLLACKTEATFRMVFRRAFFYQASNDIDDSPVESLVHFEADPLLKANLIPGYNSNTLPRISRAKPDICYGYSNTAFPDRSDNQALVRMASTAVYEKLLHWFPYQLAQVKLDGKIGDAQVQVAHDGATVANSLLLYYQSCGIQVPQPEDCAVFSLVADARNIEMYMHWRNERDESWEMSKIAQGSLYREDDIFNLRSILLNILDWAKTTRLNSIKRALAATRTPLISPPVTISASTAAPNQSLQQRSPTRTPQRSFRQGQQLQPGTSLTPTPASSRGRSKRQRVVESDSSDELGK